MNALVPIPAMGGDTLITIKLQVGTENRRFKIPLRELGAHTLPDKLRSLLSIPATKHVVFERFSDSAGSYITLDSGNPSVYKQLYRAAKAKLKLRIKATISEPVGMENDPEPNPTDRLTSHKYVPPMKPDLTTNAKNYMPTDVSQTSASPMPAVEKLIAFLESVNDSPPSNTDSYQAPSVGRKEDEASKVVKIESDSDENVDEAPVPGAFADREHILHGLASMMKEPLSPRAFHVPGASFTVCCNNCDATIPDSHWHCNSCDNGDFDLCRGCVTSGVHCGDEGHFLIKRSVINGKVISSTTETVVPERAGKAEMEKEVPGAFTSEAKEQPLPEMLEMSRTCNSCVNVFEESNFVTCTVCEDYDLCISCHVGLKHGHHPKHTFKPVSEALALDELAGLLCAPGRNTRHAAICDGCDKNIYGVRHKCMNCPDWDYCSTCVVGARYIHPGHRFVPIYEAIATPLPAYQVHSGIHCDGPLCKNKRSNIVGDRYKCAVCHDTDFCANCEATPGNRHNRTHPLIKFRTPVGYVAVTTLAEDNGGENIATLGDKHAQTSSKATETTPAAQSANAATQVHTLAEVSPSEIVKEQQVQDQTQPTANLEAHFVCDEVADGSKLPTDYQFQQTWTMNNPGPHAWPAGCSVRFIGGDNMLNVDHNNPSAISDIANATESNIIPSAVQVGEEIDFHVTLKTPQRPGKAISYWRVKAADGTPFGHRLWCDIDVTLPELKATTDGVESEHVEDISKEAKEKLASEMEEKPKAEAHQSQMIFPKLEKESPVSSTHELMGKDKEPSTTVHQDISLEDQQIFAGVESLELDDDEDTDEGFLTDEEYEMLDADSDGEAINGKGKK